MSDGDPYRFEECKLLREEVHALRKKLKMRRARHLSMLFREVKFRTELQKILEVAEIQWAKLEYAYRLQAQEQSNPATWTAGDFGVGKSIRAALALLKKGT